MRVRHRMLWFLVAVGAVGAAAVATGSAWLVRDVVEDRLVERLRAETSLVAEWIEAAPPVDRFSFVERVGARLGVRVTLIDPTGIVLADSAVRPADLGRLSNHLDRPEVAAARVSGAGEATRLSSTTTERYVYSAIRLTGDGPVEYARLALPMRDIEIAQSRSTWLVTAVALAAIVLIVAAAYGAVRRLSRPVEWIADSVERAADGGAAPEAPPHGGEEIERLSEAVRRMQSTLLAKIGELDEERSVLASVIAGMREGLLLVDTRRRIRLANAAVRPVLGFDFPPEGRLLTEVARNPTIIRDVDAAFAGAGDARESVIRPGAGGRSFELHVTPLRRGSGETTGVLVLLFDISRLETLERVRREFVANVSHELRTPLTSIKASVESLLDENFSQEPIAVRFLDIIRRNASHMGDLIEDLTDLSLIETGAISLEPTSVDLSRLTREVAERLGPQAAERRVAVRVDLPLGFTVDGDRRRLEQMLTNLLENAIKFNREDGEVVVSGERGADGTTVRVADTGIGIPSDSLDRIFNRFFQISRERSRSRRGTGLGLAIVKHLMRLHGGTVRVESEIGQGATFVLQFPREPPPEIRLTARRPD